MTLPILSKRLKQVREQNGLSQRELAERCDMGAKQIWRYENDAADPTATHLARLSNELSVSVDYLLGLVDEPAANLTEQPEAGFELAMIRFSRFDPLAKLQSGLSWRLVAEQHVNQYTQIVSGLTIMFRDRQYLLEQQFYLNPYAAAGVDKDL